MVSSTNGSSLCRTLCSFNPQTTNASSGCRQCGHAKCNRPQSIEKENIYYIKSTSDVKTIRQRSFTNLVRQNSADSTEKNAATGHCDSVHNEHSSSRLSLFDAHRLSQTISDDDKSDKGAKCKSLRLRECVTCADVFLEAMGNATTCQNNNSSRYVNL